MESRFEFLEVIVRGGEGEAETEWFEHFDLKVDKILKGISSLALTDAAVNSVSGRNLYILVKLN